MSKGHMQSNSKDSQTERVQLTDIKRFNGRTTIIFMILTWVHLKFTNGQPVCALEHKTNVSAFTDTGERGSVPLFHLTLVRVADLLSCWPFVFGDHPIGNENNEIGQSVTYNSK